MKEDKGKEGPFASNLIYNILKHRPMPELKTMRLSLDVLSGAYVFYDGSFWRVVYVDDILKLEECKVSDVPPIMNHAGMIMLLNQGKEDKS